jgi:serine/threonine protein kinase
MRSGFSLIVASTPDYSCAMSDFNRWEKVKELGSGGQSTVYLARNPKRSQERGLAVVRLQILSDGAKHEELLKLGYELNRPELPEELGALKIFKFRPGSGAPVERLKREVEILAQNLPNLPRLLDSNADAEEPWMITEYFPNGTLGEKRNWHRYIGEPLKALVAFRGLVKTIAELHNSRIVHRDIKRENVFVGADGSLVPGDFGLVWLKDTSRLTLSKEAIGPWQHLPRWANMGTRFENPTAAIDVYLLGSLLWSMVSGRDRLHGDWYEREEYNLENQFPENKQMRLVNLVLSQCLGAEEKLCVPNAGDVLTVVDEVIAAITNRAPLFDENDALAIPCAVCRSGFYRPKSGPDGPFTSTLVFHKDNYPVATFTLEPYECDVCYNIINFQAGFPRAGLQRDRKPRVNPQQKAKSPLRW